MTLSKSKPPTKPRYDWAPIVEAAIQNPGEWIREDDPLRPSTNAHQIRRGSPLIFEPNGAFDAVNRKDGLYVRYLGVPIKPWTYYDDERDFATIERTFDPDRFPDDTPQSFIDRAELHTPRKFLKRERKARGATFSTSDPERGTL